MELTDFGLKITVFLGSFFFEKSWFFLLEITGKAITLQAEIPKIFPAKGLPESHQKRQRADNKPDESPYQAE